MFVEMTAHVRGLVRAVSASRWAVLAAVSIALPLPAFAQTRRLLVRAECPAEVSADCELGALQAGAAVERVAQTDATLSAGAGTAELLRRAAEAPVLVVRAVSMEDGRYAVEVSAASSRVARRYALTTRGELRASIAPLARDALERASAGLAVAGARPPGRARGASSAPPLIEVRSTRHNPWLFIVGTGLFALSYGAALVMSSEGADLNPNAARVGVYPLAGTFLARQRLSDDALDAGWGIGTLAAGIVEVVGFAMMAGGAVLWGVGYPQTERVPAPRPRSVSVLPSLTLAGTTPAPALTVTW